ncbi:glycosyltransferase [candidate division KSB1 bacterium]|nr:glycosyltransferase [candidate division KSB1 bacterium]
MTIKARQTVQKFILFFVKTETSVLTQVGRFDPVKGFDRVFKIYKLVKEKIPEVQLLLTGAGASDDPEFYDFIKGIKDLVAGDRDAVAEEIPFDVKLLNAIQQASTIIYAMSTKKDSGLLLRKLL